MSENRINTELLEKVKAHILEEPRRYNQRTFGGTSDEAPCGTAACIAGWAAHLSGEIDLKTLRRGGSTIEGIAQAALGLTYTEAHILFAGDPTPCFCGRPTCKDAWPQPYAERYAKAETAEDRARAAADYIDHIIATGKVTD